MWTVPELNDFYKISGSQLNLLNVADYINAAPKGAECSKLNLDSPPKELEVLNEFVPEPMHFYPPSSIFGSPFRVGVLSGADSTSLLKFPAQGIYGLANAKVIGAESLLTQSGCLYIGGRLQTQKLFSQLKPSSHLGFIPLVDQQSVIYKSSEVKDHIKRAIFLGVLESSNYGSFLFRLLPKLLLLQSRIRDIDLIVIPDRAPWIMEVLAYFYPGIPVAHSREVAGLNFEHIYFCNDFSFEGFYSSNILELLNKFILEFAGVTRSETQKKIYISRIWQTRARPNYRPLMNETAIAELLIQNGFKIVCPEQYSLRDQIRLFSNANVIIGTSGSGMLNSIFADPGAFILDIEVDSQCVRQHAKIYSSSGKKYGFLFGKPRDSSNPVFGSWDIDINDLKTSLDFINSL